jgi:hypothetical protein
MELHFLLFELLTSHDDSCADKSYSLSGDPSIGKFSTNDFFLEVTGEKRIFPRPFFIPDPVSPNPRTNRLGRIECETSKRFNVS